MGDVAVFPNAQSSAKKITGHVKKQKNLVQSNEQIKSSETNPKEMEIYKLPDKEFKVIFMKLNDDLQGTQIDNYAKSGKQYMDKMRIPTKRNYLKKIKRTKF